MHRTNIKLHSLKAASPSEFERWLRLSFKFIIFFGLTSLLACVSAQAAPSCSGGAPTTLIYVQNNAAVSYANLNSLINANCTGLTIGAAYRTCTTSSIINAYGTGGTTASPYRTAKSPSGILLNYQLLNGNGNTVSGNDTTYYRNSPGPTNTADSLFANNPFFISVPAQSLTVAGDYSTEITFTQNIQQGSGYNCTDPVVGAPFSLTIPLVFRVGTTCQFNSATPNVDMGVISISSGSTINSLAGSMWVAYSCNTGMAYTLNISAGNHPDGSGNRQLANGSSYISYTIVTPSYPGPSTTFPSAGQNLTGSSDGGGATVNLGVSVPSQAVTNLTAGYYTDTVIISLTW